MERFIIVLNDGVTQSYASDTYHLLRQTEEQEGQYALSSSLVTRVVGEGNSYLICQNKTSGKSFFWNWNLDTAPEFRTPTVAFGGAAVTSICASKCGKWLFRGLFNGSIMISSLPFTLQEGKVNSDIQKRDHFQVNTRHIGSITCISTSEDGWIAFGGQDQSITVCPISYLFNTSYDSPLLQEGDNSLVCRFQHHLPVTELVLRKDRLYSISKDQTCKIWDIPSKSRLYSVSFGTGLNCLCVSSTEDAFYVGAQNGKIYKVSTSKLIEQDMDIQTIYPSLQKCSYVGHQQAVTCLSATLDEAKLISTSNDGKTHVWDEKTMQLLHVFSPTTTSKIPVACYAVLPNSSNYMSPKVDLVQTNYSQYLHLPSQLDNDAYSYDSHINVLDDIMVRHSPSKTTHKQNDILNQGSVQSGPTTLSEAEVARLLEENKKLRQMAKKMVGNETDKILFTE